MKKNKLRFNESINTLMDYVDSSETDPNVIGYALYNLKKKSFISGFDENEQPFSYSGDVNEAIFFETKFDAFSAGYFLEQSIVCVPLLENKLFGLIPKPGSLDEITSSDERENNSN